MIKYLKTFDDVEEIIDSLPQKELDYLWLDEDGYLTPNQYKYILHREIKYVNDIPVAFFDLLDDIDIINVVFATRYGKEYRHKGYAREVATKSIEWIKMHPEKIKGRSIVWGVDEDNIASITLAKELGFAKEPNSYNDGWVNYVLKEI